MRASRELALLLALGSVLAGVATPARAHTRSVSYSSWEFDASGARVALRIALYQLTRLPPQRLSQGSRSGDPVAAYVAARLRLRAGEAACRAGPPIPGRASEGWAVYEWRIACPDAAGDFEIESELLLDVSPSHLHFARARLADGSVVERVLSESEPLWRIAAPAERGAPAAVGTSLVGYVLLGVEHILTGYDHLAFVAALLLLAASVGQVAGLVTSFTLAHSVTLAVAVLGVVKPDAGAVEALIGFSIALVAAENAWLSAGRDRATPRVVVFALLGLAALAAAGVGSLSALTLLGLAVFSQCHFALLARARRPERLRAALAFAFGLVHGFGFAGVLAEMELPSDRLAPALFGFNVGVELGQLAVIGLAWPLLRALARAGTGRHRVVADLGSAAICGLGLFLFVTRCF